jgi:predicted MPP superfamily phosphohydrolase
MKLKRLLGLIAFTCILGACVDELTPDVNLNSADSDLLKSAKKPVKIAVVSDIHYFDPSLLINGAENGTAFQAYLAADPKLIQFSKPIFNQVLAELQTEMPDILLIPGDLTKDGEKISHKAMANILQNVAKKGIKVYVIPGNHDINNPGSIGYDGNVGFETPTITAAEFASIYSDFGYKKAKERDPNSLSYLCEPFSNLWILGIDACKYDQNLLKAEVSGEIKPETMAWIQEKLKKAKKDKITVLAMMHHGIMEHYIGQETLDKGFVVDNWTERGKELMDAGVQIVFTGHYHANDITMTSDEGRILYDVETGSLVTAPSPYRIATLLGDKLSVCTNKITTIDYPIPGDIGFVNYSNAFLSTSMDGYFSYMLANMGMGLDPTTIGFVAPRFTHAIMAHYSGDESISGTEQYYLNMLAGYPFLYGALNALWTDLPPSDNTFEITLQ